ncbi:unnamed protein product [Dibothriocephalus latus]|uniref:Uncharacterized protein n=1 Tax=Dibothriocephalus latus TaxID=60516 RepID=A0A3P6T3U2_DIBLA|nr:unnamed protein product [Dibothriocephalus latus]
MSRSLTHSLMKARNNLGPKTELCESALTTGIPEDCWRPTCSLWDRPAKSVLDSKEEGPANACAARLMLETLMEDAVDCLFEVNRLTVYEKREEEKEVALHIYYNLTTPSSGAVELAVYQHGLFVRTVKAVCRKVNSAVAEEFLSVVVDYCASRLDIVAANTTYTDPVFGILLSATTKEP